MYYYKNYDFSAQGRRGRGRGKRPFRGDRGHGIRGSRGHENRGSRGQGNRGSHGQDNRGTRGQGNRGTHGHGNRGTRGQGNRDYGDSDRGNRYQKLIVTCLTLIVNTYYGCKHAPKYMC